MLRRYVSGRGLLMSQKAAFLSVRLGRSSSRSCSARASNRWAASPISSATPPRSRSIGTARLQTDRVSRSPSALVGRGRRLSEVDGGRPAAEELERLFGARARLSGVGEDRQPVVCGEVQPVVAQTELTNHGMVELLDTGLVEAHVVPGPAGAEHLALCCELADQV